MYSTENQKERLLMLLDSFRIDCELLEVIEGPTVTMFVIRLNEGIRFNKLKNLTEDLELNLPAERVRILPITSKSAIGIEVPSLHRRYVLFNQFNSYHNANNRIPFYLGKDIMNRGICIDLSKQPHLLIAGSTGSGKSLCVNSLICSIITKKRPDEVRLVLVDPKRVELSLYNSIPHLIGNVIFDCDETISMLDGLIHEMNRRYDLLNRLSARNLEEYNFKSPVRKLRRIVLIIDEFADFMSSKSKELEPRIARLTAMARAVGIHLVLATQRPSADVITGIIKANIPSRIAFQVSSSLDSRIILDQSGAEKLIGKGDMLASLRGKSDLMRIQGAYLDSNDIMDIVSKVRK